MIVTDSMIPMVTARAMSTFPSIQPDLSSISEINYENICIVEE